MATMMRSAALKLPLLLLTVLLAGCSLFGSGTHRHGSVVREDRPRLQIPDSDGQLEAHIPSQVILRMEEGHSPEVIASQLGAQIVDALPSLDAALLQLPAGLSVVEVLSRLQDEGGVRYAEPNYEVHGGPTGFGAVDGPLFAFDDDIDIWSPANTFAAHQTAAHPPIHPRQWGLYAVGADKAWEYSTGEDVVIAVLDTGIDPSHPDLGHKIIDGVNTLREEGDDWADDRGHGTHVAGIAAGAGSPGGIVGVAYNARLLAVKVLNSGGTSDAFSIAKGLMWVLDWKEKHPGTPVVINMSLASFRYQLLHKDAIDKALEKGIVVVAAMGNDASARSEFPAGYPGVIAVGAVGPGYRPASFSTSWKHISVSAPGVDIYSAQLGGRYGTSSGTSQATPFVAGAAALLLAYDNTLSPAQVRSRLEAFAYHPRGAGRWDEQFGHGVINIPASFLGDRDRVDFYGTVVVRLEDHAGDLITTEKYGMPPALYQSDFFIDVRLEHEDRLDVGPIRAGSAGLATFHHVPAGSGYKAAAVAWSKLGDVSYGSVDVLPVEPGQIQEVTIKVNLEELVP